MSSEDYGDSDYGDDSMGYGSDGSDQGYGSDGDFAYSDDDGAGMGSPLAKGVRVSLAGRQGRRDRLGRPARCRQRQAAGHSPRARRPPPSGASWLPCSLWKCTFNSTCCPLQKTFVVMDKDELRERLKAAVAQVSRCFLLAVATWAGLGILAAAANFHCVTESTGRALAAR